MRISPFANLLLPFPIGIRQSDLAINNRQSTIGN